MNSPKNYKGIILAGGTGTRLSPITKTISKQLLPVYNKPMIYYPLSTLMIADIREFLIITTKEQKQNFYNLLGDGSNLGISINYQIQEEANGLAQAFILGEEFIGNSNVVLILGDNLFHGNDLQKYLSPSKKDNEGAVIFTYPVSNPSSYGIVEFDINGKVVSIEEKPKIPKSRYAITGLYFFDRNACKLARELKPSSRGELEITDLINKYLHSDKLKVELFGRGMAWFDTGKFDSLHEASSYVRTLEKRQGLKLGCPEEVAWRLGWISDQELSILIQDMKDSEYGEYLSTLISQQA